MIINDVDAYYRYQLTAIPQEKDKSFVKQLRELGRALLLRVGAEHPNWRKRSLDETVNESTVDVEKKERETDQDQLKSTPTSEDNNLQRPVKMALYQRGADAYLFSGASLLNTTEEELDENLTNVGEIRKMTILPTPSLSQVPTLGQVVGPAVQPPATSLHRYRDWSTHRVQPVAFLDYGPYSSFAPSYDVNMANLASSDSARVAIYKQQQRQKQRKKQLLLEKKDEKAVTTTDDSTKESDDVGTTKSVGNNDIDKDVFKRHGIDLDLLTQLEARLIREEKEATGLAIKAAITTTTTTTAAAAADNSNDNNNDNNNTTTRHDVETVLLKNAGLLLELQILQEERFSEEHKDPKRISELERQLAKTLQQNLVQLVEQTKPKVLIAPQLSEENNTQDSQVSNIIEQAMARLPHWTPAYRGTLPSNRPFAYGSNYGSRTAHPPAATVVPGTRSDTTNATAAQVQLLQRQLQANSAATHSPSTPVQYNSSAGIAQ
ncbi:hypothetical protein BDF19DRAFT_423056 [Syncephalis fuscata]|nr:hypothetical protein BDF19DRAFT_423056 [Syncephalis fuscata]